MGKGLSAQQVTAYRKTGIHFPLRILDEAGLARIRPNVAKTREMMGGRFGGSMNQKPYLLFPWLADLARNEKILDAVEDVLGTPDILCWSGTVFAKDAGDGKFVSWHQYATYWGLSSTDVVTAWVALTPSTVASGCMRVMPGSHLRQLEHKDTLHQSNLLSRGQEIAVEVDDSQAIDVVLQPGEFSLHHVLLVHGSEPNRAALPRIGFAIRYIPTSLRQVTGYRDSATLLRGVDRYGNFDLEELPRADLDAAALAQHARVAENQKKLFHRETRKPTVG